MFYTHVQPVIISVLVVLEVAVWQVRVALATRGRKRSAAVLGAVNAVLSVAAIGQVVTNLDRPANIAGYALGVAVGVYLGVVADERFAADPVEYRVVLPSDGGSAADELTSRGWSVTTQHAEWRGAPAIALQLVATAGSTARAERDIEELAPGAARTSIRLRSARPAALQLMSEPLTTGRSLPETRDDERGVRVPAGRWGD